MAEQQSSILIGVFKDMVQARQAYNNLRSAGFGDDYLGFADPQGIDSRLGNNLAQAGVPETDSQFYEREFQAGHPIITLRIGGLQEESIQKARDILKNNDAYDATSVHNQGELGSKVKTDERTPFFDVASGAGESQG